MLLIISGHLPWILSTVVFLQLFRGQRDMPCANHGSGQSMDCAAQSMDPCFSRAIHGLPSTCAIHGLRNHTHVPSVRQLKSSCMFNWKAAFEADCITKSFVQKKNKGSKVISREKGNEKKSWLTFRLAKTMAIHWVASSVFVWLSLLILQAVILLAVLPEEQEPRDIEDATQWGLLMLLWLLHPLPSYYSLSTLLTQYTFLLARIL